MQRATGERQIPELRGGISLRCNNGLSAAAPRGWAGFSAIFMDGRADEKNGWSGDGDDWKQTTGRLHWPSLRPPCWAVKEGGISVEGRGPGAESRGQRASQVRATERPEKEGVRHHEYICVSRTANKNREGKM
jgi:hypothetical protein